MAKLRTKMNMWRHSAEKYSKDILYPLIRSPFLEISTGGEMLSTSKTAKAKLSLFFFCIYLQHCSISRTPHSSELMERLLAIDNKSKEMQIMEC